MTTRKVKPGDPLKVSAPTWNSFIDAANANQVVQGSGGRQERPDLILVRCKNIEEGATIERHRPVAAQDLLISEGSNAASFHASPALRVTRASYDIPRLNIGTIGIAYESIRPGEIGRVAFGGVIPCEVDLKSYDDDIAIPHDSLDTALEGHAQGAVGPRIISKDSGPLGVTWCLLQLGEYRSKFASLYLGTITDAITEESDTATVDNLGAMNGEPLDAFASVTSTLDANNRFLWAASADANCLVGWNESATQWELLQVEC